MLKIKTIIKFTYERNCCDRKSRAACAQSFALWQQATTEICSQSLLLLLVHATYIIGVILHAHLIQGESHNQRNTTGKVATKRKGRNTWEQTL